MSFRAISHSWVAPHPAPVGVVEFIGGALYGLLPTIAYRHLLNRFYDAGYTVVAMPFSFGFNHGAIAKGILEERGKIRAELNYSENLPDVWVGHSVGCKYITLLEAMGDIIDQPSLLMAPDISDIQDALPIPPLARFLERLSLGIRPNRRETQTLVQQSQLFKLTALLSFNHDEIAGNVSQPSDKSDVAWFFKELKSRNLDSFIHQELPGGHREPIGLRIGRWLLRPEVKGRILVALVNHQTATQALSLLAVLSKKQGKLSQG